MKAIHHFKQNRPVHLARRDAYFEEANKLIHARHEQGKSEINIADYEEIIFLLRVARLHAIYSIRETGKNENDEQFYRFIDLLAGNVKAILSMLNLKGMVESSENSIASFLGENKASIALQAEEYQRRANDFSCSILNTLKLAQDPIDQLKKENANALSPDETQRYAKSFDHSALQIKEGKHRYKITASPRKVSRL